MHRCREQSQSRRGLQGVWAWGESCKAARLHLPLVHLEIRCTSESVSLEICRSSVPEGRNRDRNRYRLLLSASTWIPVMNESTSRSLIHAQLYLQWITSLRLSVNHLHYFFVDTLPSRVSLCPVISGPSPILRNEDVLRVVQICVGRRKDVVNDLYAVTQTKDVACDRYAQTLGSRSTRMARGI